MNVITLLHNLRDAVADDTATKAWCQTNYSRDHKVYVGIDDRKPPADAEYPLVHLFPLTKTAGYELASQDHGIGATCGVHNETTTATGKANAIELTGIIHIEEFRKLVETAIISAADWPVRVASINIEYETVEFFPFFLAAMEIKLAHDYSQGEDVFA
jgi:hypothetical protein